MKPLRIAQLAAFRGNIGDNANVVGTRALLRRNFACPLEFTNLEYLEYEPDPRWGGKSFDVAFVEIVNAHDLLMIGGGGFFELAVDRSATGTPIDFSTEILDLIQVPIVFYALGFDVSYGIRETRTEKFRTFLDDLLQRRNVLISVRNDGSLETLRSVVGESYARQIDKVPDGGFFTQTVDSEHIELPPKGKRIAINLAGDGLAARFKECNPSEHARCDEFLERLASVINGLFLRDETIHAILVPHIPEDLAIIARFVEKIGPPFCRKRITVAPYVHGKEAQGYVFDLYSKCDAVIGMRFHANVCPIGLGVPTIGLITHVQVENLYRELEMPERSLRADAGDFEQRLEAMIDDLFVNGDAISAEFRKMTARLEKDVSRFHAKMLDLVSCLIAERVS